MGILSAAMRRGGRRYFEGSSRMRREDAIARMLYEGRAARSSDDVRAALSRYGPGQSSYVPSGAPTNAEERSMVGDFLGSAFGDSPGGDGVTQMRRLLRREGFANAETMSDSEVMKLAEDYVPRLMALHSAGY